MGAGLWAAVRLDLGEVLRSRWMLFCAGVYLALGAIFVLVGLRESLVLGFTGLGRVLFSLCHALVLVLPLLALTGAGPAVVRSREEGSLEFWLSQPIGRGAWLVGVTAVRYLALALPLAVVLGGLALWAGLGLGQPVPWAFLGQALLLCGSLLWAFVALGIATSVRVRSLARATTLLLLFWALAVALVDFALIGLLLEWRLPPQAVFALAAANPVQAVRVALLAGAEPELSVLGPVGFYLVNRLGAEAVFAVGVGWPLVFGGIAWAFAWRAFRTRDLV
jgi:ABC-type transport system involved in multi-copper enzyme maturation permease subunit